MQNLCSKYFNINNSNKDLKEKLVDEPIKSPLLLIQKKMKKNFEKKKK